MYLHSFEKHVMTSFFCIAEMMLLPYPYDNLQANLEHDKFPGTVQIHGLLVC